jgi:hypothetical protein
MMSIGLPALSERRRVTFLFVTLLNERRGGRDAGLRRNQTVEGSEAAPSIRRPTTTGALRGALYQVKTVVARYPSLALPLARLRRHGVVLAPGTDLVIEGFPRSANSFAVAAFLHAQPERLRVAEHTHAPGHVIAAIRAGVPVLILIRDPADACVELVIAKPHLTLRQALGGYARFYEPLVPHRGGFVVATFSQVTTDFGRVIERVNTRFGTSFIPFEHTPENVRACFDTMEGYWRGRVGTGPELERKVGRPSALREDLKTPFGPVYRSEELARVRERAEYTYRTWLQIADAGAGTIAEAP